MLQQAIKIERQKEREGEKRRLKMGLKDVVKRHTEKKEEKVLVSIEGKSKREREKCHILIKISANHSITKIISKPSLSLLFLLWLSALFLFLFVPDEMEMRRMITMMMMIRMR